MKKFFRWRPVLPILFILTALSCATEDAVVYDNVTSPAPSARIINAEEINAIQGVAQKLDQLKKAKTDLAGRPVSSVHYNFEVDTEQALLIERDGYQSLTFPIGYDADGELLRNLFLHPYGDKFIPYLLTYKISATQMSKLNEGTLTDEMLPHLLVQPLSDLDADLGLTYENITASGDYARYWLGTDGKCYADVNLGNDTWGYVECPKCDCPRPASGGGSAGGGSSFWWVTSPLYFAIIDTQPKGGGGGSPTGPRYSLFNPDPINPKNPVAGYPDPIIGIVSPDLPKAGDSRCTELKNNSQNPTFNEKMGELKAKAGTQNFESAYPMYNTAGSRNFGAEAQGSPESPEVSLNMAQSATQSPLNCIGFIHCHLDNGKTFKVFSFSDLIALATVASVSTRPTAELAIYVTTASGTLAIKVSDKIALKAKLLQMVGAQQAYERDFAALVDMNDNTETQSLNFLKFMDETWPDSGSGIELYQQAQDGSWENLSLNTNKNGINRKKC